MIEGMTDQLFLALRIAAIGQSVAAGVRLPFLADDLFVNFDETAPAPAFGFWRTSHAPRRCCSSRITSFWPTSRANY